MSILYMNSLAVALHQPQYMEGYEAFKEGIIKNPFENLSQKFQAQRVYWEMGWEDAKKDENAINQWKLDNPDLAS